MERLIHKLLAMAARDNIAVKIRGACTLSHEPFPYKDIWDPLGRIFDAFGFGRCMWGTDWTRAAGLLTYEQRVESFRVTDRLSDSDRALLWQIGKRLCRRWRLVRLWQAEVVDHQLRYWGFGTPVGRPGPGAPYTPG